MNQHFRWMVFAIAVMAIIIAVRISEAAPSGASIEYLGNSSRNASAAQNRTDEKGTINIMRLQTVQQDTRWKAYVGNVSGVLTLDDADQYTIYDWTVTGAIVGTVFASRNLSVNWATINCSNLTNTRIEEDSLGVTYSSSDSIENTFTSTNHTPFDIGTRQMRNCNFTALYVNDTTVPKNDSAAYQELILWDNAGAFVYASRVNDNHLSYRRDETTKYDFQMIVADSISASVSTFFFYLELQ